MAKYSYITDKTHNNRKIQVESAKRDGSGKNFENNYAKQNGNYQSLTAGLSNNFDTKKVMVDESAYNFRQTATMGSVELEVGSPCKVKKIIGGTIVFNQLVQNGNFDDTSNWYTTGGTTFSVSNNVGHASFSSNYQFIRQYISTKQGHKLLFSGKYRTISGSMELFYDTTSFLVSSNTFIEVSKIIPASADSIEINPLRRGASDVAVEGECKQVNILDLTQMFGSTIADYIYSLEQANAGSGVAWFKRYFPKEYYAYNSGELVSVKTQGKKITHFNQWDEEWELGDIDSDTGVDIPSTTRIRSANFIQVSPNTEYYVKCQIGSIRICEYGEGKLNEWLGYNSNFGLNANTTFKTSQTTRYIRFYTYNYGTTYNHDICINFHYDGERDGEYEPYNSETYACDDEELRGIPQLDENNNLVFDGDEYLAGGTKNVKYGIVDLGTLTWTRISADPEYDGFFNAQVGNIKPNTNNVVCKLFESGYSNYAYASMPNMTIRVESDGVSFTVKDTSYTDAQTFKTAMSGVYLVYELETTTTDTLTPFTEVQECDNWGTEEWLAPTTDTRPCEVPVGHETDYLPDLKAKVEVAPSTPNENGVYVMEHNASGNSYTPIATWLTDNGYAKADTLPTKDSVGGTLRQLLAVKETIDFDNTAYVDLGSLTWTYLNGKMFADLTNAFVMPNQTDISPIVCTKYKSSSINNVVNQSGNGIITLGNLGYWGEHRVAVYDSNYTNATTFKNAMKGVLLAYKKAS
jgi:hypothetical protein